MDLVWICIIAGLVAAGVVVFFVRYVLRQDQGSELSWRSFPVWVGD